MRILRIFTPVVVALIALSACGGSRNLDLTIGVVLPETGPLGISKEPAMAAVRLAEEDIKAAGGEVTFLYADSQVDPATAVIAVDNLLEEGADAILGAAASGVSQAFIQSLYESETPQCSPSNTSPSFSEQANAAFYFRTVSSDTAVVPLMSETVLGRGSERIAILARDDDYGRSLADLLVANLREQGAEVDLEIIDPLRSDFYQEISAVSDFEPDTVVLITFDEGIQILQGLLEAGFDPADIFGTDGIFIPDLPAAVDESDPGVLDGMTIFLAGIPRNDDTAALAERLQSAGVDYSDSPWAERAYDCAVILALAAQSAGTTAGEPFFAAALEVTNDGTECLTYADCSRRIDRGENVVYVGKSGPLRLDTVGDPTVGAYAISRFKGGELVEQSTVTVDLTE
ncbi:MAG: ABC transporter substrate-binding protein [bacterium]|nr:ABC transporter substrate-binding protein [bacterium]MDE0643144.1 ABC transporter substrate-binding protein [bacterium]